MQGPIFWRDDALPFIEARSIQDGRDVCYARHSHETFSIGAICKGRCTYVNRSKREQIGSGSVVLMNPGDVHACNPVRNEAWTYRMLYFDAAWVSRIQQELNDRGDDFQPFSATAGCLLTPISLIVESNSAGSSCALGALWLKSPSPPDFATRRTYNAASRNSSRPPRANTELIFIGPGRRLIFARPVKGNFLQYALAANQYTGRN
jgi:hypothetical protein